MRAWLLAVALLTASTMVSWGCGGGSASEGNNSDAPTVAEIHYNTGIELRGQGRLLEAIAEYDAAISGDRWFAWAYFNRGLAYESLGEPERALEDYAEAIRLSPRLVYAYNNRDASVVVPSQTLRDISDYDEAIRLRPGRAETHASRSLAYVILGEDAAASGDLEKAIELGFDPSLWAGLFERIKEEAAAAAGSN